VVDVVGEVAQQAGVLHAQSGRGELGVEVGDKLGESGLSACCWCRAGGGELAGQVGTVGRGVSGPRDLGDDDVPIEGLQRLSVV
jgi:hypothetical protein